MSLLTPLCASMKKELLLLGRDRAGLLVLFVMPAVLVIVITLVQQNLMQKMGDSGSKVILVDLDREELAERFLQRFAESSPFEIVRSNNEKEALARVNAGEIQLCVIVRPGMSKRIRRLAAQAVGGIPAEHAGEMPGLRERGRVDVHFDPTLLGGFRSAMLSAVDSAAMALEFEQILTALQSELSRRFASSSELFPLSDDGGMVPALDATGLSEQRLIKVGEATILHDDEAIVPNAVQQNVPAWALFGVFFIVVPLSGSLIKERLTGVLGRVLVMPVSAGIILLGKITVYALVCLLQFVLILGIGKILLPLLGTQAFAIGTHYSAVALLIAATVSAAASYGILVGVLARTFDQASMFGAISVVIAAAIGGVMVPVHAMPETMRILSHVSPVGWALRGFLEIFVRNGDLSQVLPEALLLFAFTLLATTWAWLVFTSREKHGKY